MRGGSAEAEEGLFGDGKVSSGAAADAPVSAEGRAGDSHPDEVAAGDFGGGDPGGDDADAEPECDEFFDGFQGTEFGEGAQGRVEFEEVPLDEAEGGGGAGVEDKVLFVELMAIDAAGARPGVEGAQEYSHVIGKEGVKGELFVAFGAEHDGEVGGAVAELARHFGGIADGDGQFVIGVTVAEFAQGFGDNVLAGGGGGADAERAQAGASGAFDGVAGFLEDGKDAHGVFPQDAAGVGEGDAAALAAEQGGVEGGLKGGNLMADGGLGESEGGGCAGKA